jgi:hypothetical protein
VLLRGTLKETLLLVTMKLDAFLLSQGLTQTTFGKMLSPPVTQGQVSQWLRGQSRITLQYALEIGRVTGGAVTPEDCASIYRSQQRETAQ